MPRYITLLPAFTVTLCLSAGVSAQSLSTVDALAIKPFGKGIAVARGQGGVSLYLPSGGAPVQTWATEHPANVLTTFGDALCWVEDSTRTLSIVHERSIEVERIDIPIGMLDGPIRRLSRWEDYIVVHSDRGFVFVDPKSHLIRTARNVLPSEIWKIAKLGVADSTWRDEGGMFVSIRRLSMRRTTKDREEIPDIAMITAWTMDDAGRVRLLGGYTASVTRFQTDERGDLYAAGPLGNLRLGREGVVALGLNEMFVIPFVRDNWQPDRLRTVFRPAYAQNMDYMAESAWWTDGRRAFRADLTDGSSDAYVPREDIGTIRGVLADADGAWLATCRGVRHLGFDAVGSTFEKVSAAAYDEPKTREQRALLARVETALRGGGKARTVADLLPSKGEAKRPVAEGELGDFVEAGGKKALYLGAGRILVEGDGRLNVQALKPTLDTRFTRVLKWTELTQADLHPVVAAPPKMRPSMAVASRAAAVPATSPPTLYGEGEVVPIGVNGPNFGLGNSLFVRCTVGAPFDSPQTERERRLLAIAQNWIGTPYRWGGNTKLGCDCSGFVTAVFREMGVNLPRYSQDIGRARVGKVVQDQLHFGDVLVFKSPEHVALYIGDGRTIEAVDGGVSYSTVARRTSAIVRRFL